MSLADWVSPTTDPHELRRIAREWLADHLPGDLLDAIAARDPERIRATRREIDRARWWAELSASGLATPTWPVKYGGLGLGAELGGVVAAELRRHHTPRSPNPIGHNMVAPALLRWGTEDQRTRLLPGIATQSDIWCQLFSEPGAGSDLASLATRARRKSDDVWEILGHKTWTSLADRADHGLLLARTDPAVPKHAGITAFLLDMRETGIEVRPIRQITGDAEFNEVILTGAPVPDEMRLGSEGEGWAIARAVLSHERVSDSGGGALPGVVPGRSIEALLDHARGRADSALFPQLVAAWIEEEVLRATLERARQGRRAPGKQGVSGAVTKLMRTANSLALHELLLDVDGGAAIAWPPDDEWHSGSAWAYLRIQSKTIAGGTSDITRNLVGERVLGLDREPQVDRDVPWEKVRRSD